MEKGTAMIKLTAIQAAADPRASDFRFVWELSTLSRRIFTLEEWAITAGMMLLLFGPFILMATSIKCFAYVDAGVPALMTASSQAASLSK